MKKNAKIYIAGHCGLLGSAINIKLKKYGYSNIIVKSHNELDLTKQSEVFRFFSTEKPEYVFLAAGLTGGILANSKHPARFYHINTSIQDNIFEAANGFGVKKVVFYGSSCMYPKNCMQPMKEEYLLTGKVEETSEAYAMAKIGGVIACRSYNKEFSTNRFIALVPNSMFGPNDNYDVKNSHVLSSLIRKIHDAKMAKAEAITLWGSGIPRREFIYADDVADASIFAVENADKLKNHHYNVGFGCDMSIKELAEKISEIMGYEGNIIWDESRPDGAKQKLLDSSKFKALGWKPKITFEEGLKTTYEFFLKK